MSKNLAEILNIKFYCEDLREEVTIKEYFKKLLLKLWNEGESFSGKRPFGNSGWQYDLYACLIKNKIIIGTLDENGYVITLDYEEADKVIIGLIKSI